MQRKTSGNRGEDRASALWGSGNRGGEFRSNALWGKGGKGLLVAVATVALAVPFALTSNADADGGKGPLWAPAQSQKGFVQADLLARAKADPKAMFDVIVQSNAGTAVAGGAFQQTESQDDAAIAVIEAQADVAEKAASAKASKASKKADKEQAKSEAAAAKQAGDDARDLRKALKGEKKAEFNLIGGVSITISGRRLEKLARNSGLNITENQPVRLSGPAYTSSQLWPASNGTDRLWGTEANPGPTAPAIAIVDSGVDASNPSFGVGQVEQVTMTNRLPNSAGDGRGHGTFVAGIAAGRRAGYAGASPSSRIISVDVMDDNGVGFTTDVIKAAQWIYENRVAKNIKVANFSLHATSVAPFYADPLDQAVEKLWFGGVTVIAAAGNYGTGDIPSGVRYAPGNDPFVITVGALDIGGTARPRDDDMAPFSAWGRTYDGFAKPEIVAPGRYMVGPLPMTSTLATLRPASIVGPGLIQLSGTSFSAPAAAGAAAQILARHPNWTPDQVKGALMKTARNVPGALVRQDGVGEINAVAAATRSFNAPNPNAALNRFVTAGVGTFTGPAFDAVSWTDAARADVSWDSVSWTDVSWTDVSWDSVSWTDVSWTDVSWTDVSWTDVSWEDAAEAEGDNLGVAGYELTPIELVEAQTDPDLAPGPLLDAVVTTP